MEAINTETLQSLGLTNKPKATETGELGQAQFLKLMITQMQNQDPSKPMENGEFLSQIAQFGTVSGIQDLQNSLSTLSSALISNQALQASSLVGRSILVESNALSVTPGVDSKAMIDLTVSSPNVNVDILDSSNQVIKTIALGSNAKGLIDFKWDGKLDDGTSVPAGIYKLQAKAQVSGETVAMGTLVSQKVESVTLGNGTQGLSLNTATNGSYTFGQIKQVR